MSVQDQVRNLHKDLQEAVRKSPDKALGSVTRSLIKELAEQMIAASPDNKAAAMVLKNIPGTHLDVSDGLALVGQLLSSWGDLKF